MNKTGPIVIIEDDKDDQDILKEAFTELRVQNEVLFFGDGSIALEYLIRSRDQPFLIISDINLPKLNGFELRDKVHNNESLKLKCIPYLFFTTAINQKNVMEAYSKSVQGFFIKPDNYGALVSMPRHIVSYWRDCHSPNIV